MSSSRSSGAAGQPRFCGGRLRRLVLAFGGEDAKLWSCASLTAGRTPPCLSMTSKAAGRFLRGGAVARRRRSGGGHLLTWRSRISFFLSGCGSLDGGSLASHGLWQRGARRAGQRLRCECPHPKSVNRGQTALVSVQGQSWVLAACNTLASQQCFPFFASYAPIACLETFVREDIDAVSLRQHAVTHSCSGRGCA